MKTPPAGYELAIDQTHRILKVRAWGMWNVALAEQYDRELQETIIQISENGQRDWYALVDLDQFPVQNEEVQAIIVRGMKFGAMYNLQKEARIIGKALTKLQLARLVKEAGMPANSTFQSEDEAVAWLLHKGDEPGYGKQ
jgi:hypothetical protein